MTLLLSFVCLVCAVAAVLGLEAVSAQAGTNRTGQRRGHPQFGVMQLVFATDRTEPTTEPAAEPTAEPDVIPRFMRPRERPWWMQVGFGNRPPEPPVVGPGAMVQWWERVRSLIVLAALVLALGVVLAGLIGAFVAVGGYLLEQTAT